jgi:hypothetical protein
MTATQLLRRGSPLALSCLVLLLLSPSPVFGLGNRQKLARSLLQDDPVEPGKGTVFPYRT